jgi:hypothetical protein
LLRCVVQAWPLRITFLINNPYEKEEEVFEPSGTALVGLQEYAAKHPDAPSPTANVKLVYLQGCEALHSPSNIKTEVKEQRTIRECISK